MVASQVVPEELQRAAPDIEKNEFNMMENKYRVSYDLIEPWDAALLIESPQRLGGRGTVAVLIIYSSADE